MDDDGAGGIGAGGGKGKAKGPNERRLDAEAQRKARNDIQQNQPVPPPMRVFPDGSRLLFDWCHSHPSLLSNIIKQIAEICWALVLGKILEFIYNKDHDDTSQHNQLDIDSFVKLVIPDDEARDNLAVGSLNKAMNLIYSTGIKKKKDTSRRGADKTYTVKGSFIALEGTTTETIINLLVTKGPLGIILDMTPEFLDLSGGIYMVPEPVAGVRRHIVMIVAHGRTINNEVFFDIQNTWGTGWGVNGHGRIMITGRTRNKIVYLDRLLKR